MYLFLIYLFIYYLFYSNFFELFFSSNFLFVLFLLIFHWIWQIRPFGKNKNISRVKTIINNYFGKNN